MADIHILGGNYVAGNDLVNKAVVFHYDIPVVDQVAEAAQDPELVGFISAVPDLATSDPAENTAIKNGEKVEVVTRVSFNRQLPPAERLALMRAQYAAGESTVVNQYRARYYEYLSTFAR